MPITLDEARSLTMRLADELRRRQPDIDKNEGYYRGDQPLAFATAQFQAALGALFEGFADNWCGVVVDSTAERLAPTGVRLDDEDPDKQVDKESWRVWQANSLDADFGLAAVDSLALKRSFVTVWGNPDDDETPEITFEHPSQAIIGYQPGSRRRRVASLKLWTEGNTEYATLGLPDEVWKLQRRATAGADGLWVPNAVGTGGWELREGESPNPMPNPLGEVPMVEMPNRPRLRGEPSSEIASVIPMQDAVNLLWSHLMTASDFAALPQRVVLGAETPKRRIHDPETGALVREESVPLDDVMIRRILWLEDPQGKIAEWAAADLENYTKVIEVAVGHIAAQTRTPQHYLIGKMANLSAEALKAAETGLVSKVGERQVTFGESIREVMRLAALAQDDKARARALSTATVLWKDPESRSEAERVDAALKLHTLGVPFRFLMKRVGYSETEIAILEQEREREMERDPLGAITQAIGQQEPQQPEE